MSQVEKEKVLDLMQKIGFTDYEARVYITLVTEGSLNPTQLSNLSGVPRPNVYAVLKKLIRKGFAEKEAVKRAPLYSAVPPDIVLKTIKEDLKNKEQHTETLKKWFQEDRIAAPGRMPTAWLIDGEKRITEIVEDLLQRSKNRIHAIITPTFIKPNKEPNSILKILEEKAKQNIDIIAGWKINQDTLEIAQTLSQHGTIYHWSLGEIPLGTYIADGKDCLVSFIGKWEPIPTYDLGIWIRNPTYVKPFEYLAERLLSLNITAKTRIKELQKRET
ncbi:MAG: TrmB family transcriptional regulator [Candidatus Jordarchaeum sp.]|uniref:TrmB family transcriptional regulator n=1 Tax=Candidatus Jordarchaeum sp. TaxID=2823881 RepID=UPI00404AFAF8